jgi:hypothetical protein
MPRFIGTLAFASRNVLLDGAPFRPEQFPHLIEPAERIDRERGATVLLVQPPQKGKSLLSQLYIARNAAVAPVRTLLYSPTQEDGKAFVDEKLEPLLRSITAVNKHRPLNIDEQGGKLVMKFVDAPVSMLGASIQSHRNSRSGQVIVMDESWQYESGAISEIDRRSEAPGYIWCRRIVHTMTGPTGGSDAAALWQASSQHTWHMRCLSCGGYTPVERARGGDTAGVMFDRVTDDDGLLVPHACAETVRWVCPMCGESTSWSVANRKAMMDGAHYKPLNEQHKPLTFGYRINAWAFDAWPTLVDEWCRALNQRRVSSALIEDFTRKKDVRVWEPVQTDAALVDYPIGDYKMADEWPDEHRRGTGDLLRFMTVDVQQNHFWVVIRSWSRKGVSRLRWFGKALVPSELEDLRVKHLVAPSLVWVDSAYSTTRVTQMCSRYGWRMFNSVKPQDWRHADGVRRIYSEPRMFEVSDAGKAFRALQVLFSSQAAKDMLETLRAYRDGNGLPIWTIAADTPANKNPRDDYKRQAWAWVRRQVPKPKGGYAVEWVQKFDDDHAQDCECAQVVLAAMAGILPGEKPPEG